MSIMVDIPLKLRKEIRPEIAIIAQTAYAMDNEKEEFMRIFNEYFIKPINGDELLQKLMKYIGK